CSPIIEDAPIRWRFMKSTNWKEIHERISELAKARAALDEEQGRLLLAAWRANVHSHLGYATMTEYVERLFGCGPREAESPWRVARALETLPETAAALRAGRMCWSAVRELSRVAVPENECAWLEGAGGKKGGQDGRVVE